MVTAISSAILIRCCRGVSGRAQPYPNPSPQKKTSGFRAFDLIAFSLSCVCVCVCICACVCAVLPRPNASRCLRAASLLAPLYYRQQPESVRGFEIRRGELFFLEAARPILGS